MPPVIPDDFVLISMTDSDLETGPDPGADPGVGAPGHDAGEGGWRERLRKKLVATHSRTSSGRRVLEDRVISKRQVTIIPMGGEPGFVMAPPSADSPAASRTTAEKPRYRECALGDAVHGGLIGVVAEADFVRLLCYYCKNYFGLLVDALGTLVEKDGGCLESRVRGALEIIVSVCRKADHESLRLAFGGLVNVGERINWFEVDIRPDSRVLFNRSVYYLTRGTVLDVLAHDHVQFNQLTAYFKDWAENSERDPVLGLASELRSCRDFNSLMALVSAIPPSRHAGLCELVSLCSPVDNYRLLRTAQKAKRGVPWLGLHRRDITFCEDAHAHPHATHGTVNWRAARAVGAVLQDIYEAQRRLR